MAGPEERKPIDNDGEDRRETPASTEESTPPRRSRGFLLVLTFLIALIGIALIVPGETANVETSEERVLLLLQRGKLVPDSLRFIQDKKVFIGKIERSREEIREGLPERFRIAPGSDQGIYDFKQEVKKHNAKEQDPAKWINFVPQESHGELWSTITQIGLLFVFFLILYFVFIRPMRAVGPGGSLFSFGKSHARVARKGATGVTFDDVAGIDEAKSEVREIIEFLKNPNKFLRLGGRIPRGVVLAGSPGTGKTLLARAIAGEADVPFFSISGSDFVEMFVGVGASRVRDLFKQARESSPCIIFLDEIDAVGRRRGAGLGGGHDEREQTLNAILVEMDGFDSDAGIVMIAATNRPDVLDPALLRPGRFDREIVIDLPDVHGREEILEVHTKRVKIADDVDLRRLAQLTPTFSGAELAALVNEAAILAAMRDKTAVNMAEFEEARDKIRFGRERSNRSFTEDDLRITAYHEAGHAIVAHLLPEVEPLHKVTIIPRGMALGATMQIPERDRYHLSRKQLHGNLMVLYAGRIAEEMFCDDITAGATNDIERATEIARRMVCEWGMSEAIGPINYADVDETAFLGRDPARARTYSESIAENIDNEVRRLVDTMYKRTEKLIRDHRKEVDRIAVALLRKETLTGEEVAALVEGKEIELPEQPKDVEGDGAEPETRR